MPATEQTAEDVKELEQQRLKKLALLRENDIDAYPPSFKREHTSEDILEQYFPEGVEQIAKGSVTTAGRVIGKRPMGKAGFLEIADQFGKIQVYANNKTIDEKDYLVFQNLDIGDIVGISGEPFLTKTKEPSIRARKLTILSKNLSPLPVVKEKDGNVFDAFKDVETRYRKRYIDLIVNEQVRKDFFLRSQIIFHIRQFLHERGFLEVETPMMQTVASGAAAKPFETYHNTLNMQLFLRIAPELYLKRLTVGGFERVFELNRNFRNEGLSSKHNPEFTMLEVYQAYADYTDMMQLTEDLFVSLADSVLGTRRLPFGKHTISLEPPWQKKAYLEIIAEKTGLDFKPFVLSGDLPLEKGQEMAKSIGVEAKGCQTFWGVVDEVFSQKVENELIQPIFITDFPKAISPLAKSIAGDEHFVERFEPYIIGRELGNAFSELNDPLEQQTRFEQQIEMRDEGAEETIVMDEDFVEALKVGMPPTGGLGIGIDRLVMLFTNNESIKDVILFPLLRKRA